LLILFFGSHIAVHGKFFNFFSHYLCLAYFRVCPVSNYFSEMRLTNHLLRSILTAFALLFTITSFAQEGGTVKGFVYDKRTGEPLIGSNVFVVGKKVGMQTDNNGYFSLTLPSGTYTLQFTSLGYDSSLLTVSLLPDAVVTKKVLLSQQGMELKAVEVSGRKTEKTTKINTGLTKITPQEMKKLPSAGGEPDLAQYLQEIRADSCISEVDHLPKRVFIWTE
jgi:hypothetical protein